MEDPSVDTSSIGRKELLAKIGGIKLPGSTTQLQVRLRKNIVKNHPIKNYLNELDRKIVEEIYKKIVSRPNINHYDRIKKFVYDHFFERCGKAPLSSLKWLMDTGNFPDVAQVGKFYEQNLIFTPTGRSVDLKMTGDPTEKEHDKESINLSETEKKKMLQNVLVCLTMKKKKILQKALICLTMKNKITLEKWIGWMTLWNLTRKIQLRRFLQEPIKKILRLQMNHLSSMALSQTSAIIKNNRKKEIKGLRILITIILNIK